MRSKGRQRALVAALTLMTPGALAQNDGDTYDPWTIEFDLVPPWVDVAEGVAVDTTGRVWVVGRASSASDDFAVGRLRPQGGLDPSFGAQGRATYGFDRGGANRDEGIVVLPEADGGAVLVGSIQRNGTGDWDVGAIRMSPNGVVDTTWGSSLGFPGQSVVAIDFGGVDEDRVADAARLPDGSIVVAGCSTASFGADGFVVKIDALGAPVPGFGDGGIIRIALDHGGGRDDCAEAVAIDSSGRIVVAGWTEWGSFSSTDHDFFVQRYTADGAVDPTFTAGTANVLFDRPGSTGDDRAFDVAIDPTGSIVVSGWAATAGGGTDLAVARLTAAGSLDASFSGDGRQTVDFGNGAAFGELAVALVVDDRRRVHLGGIAQWGTSNTAMGFARLRGDGSLDPLFGVGGKRLVFFYPAYPPPSFTEDTVSDLAMLPNGDLMAVGSCYLGSNGMGVQDRNFCTFRVHSNHGIFSDSFESGDTSGWSTP